MRRKLGIDRQTHTQETTSVANIQHTLSTYSFTYAVHLFQYTAYTIGT